jgi:uncharacterized protein
MNPVVHFELPAENIKRMSDFYKKVFGWKSQMFGAEEGQYVVVTTSETDKSGRPKMTGTINGGFYKKEKNSVGQHPSIVIAVNDIKKVMNSIKKAKGKILGKPSKIKGIGLYLSFQDTEGNLVSVLKPEMLKA